MTKRKLYLSGLLLSEIRFVHLWYISQSLKTFGQSSLGDKSYRNAQFGYKYPSVPVVFKNIRHKVSFALVYTKSSMNGELGQMRK